MTTASHKPMIESIQKVIKVGDSIAVTIPAKEARVKGIKAGDLVSSSHTPVEKKQNIGIADDYAKFAKQYDSALKNLSDR